jgi:hypothetical protein
LDDPRALGYTVVMSGMKCIVFSGFLCLFAACTQSAPPPRHAAVDTHELLRRKTVRSPYIAKAHVREPRLVYPRLGEYQNYGLIDAPIAAPPGPGGEVNYAPSELTPTGAHRSVINQVTNEPVR